MAQKARLEIYFQTTTQKRSQLPGCLSYGLGLQQCLNIPMRRKEDCKLILALATSQNREAHLVSTSSTCVQAMWVQGAALAQQLVLHNIAIRLLRFAKKKSALHQNRQRPLRLHSNPNLGRRMAQVSLSCSQLRSAILLESHLTASQCMFSVVVEAVQAAHPESWNEALCSCFGVESVGRHVKQRLDDGIAVTDFYAVSKAVRSRLGDVAKLSGGELLEPCGRERLSLQIQGVETARHWLFHDEQLISSGELRASILLLVTILTTISRGSLQSLSAITKLHSLLRCADELATFRSDFKHLLISSSSVRKALLQTAFVELKCNFTAFFRDREDCNSDDERKHTLNAKSKSTSQRKSQGEYATLFAKIRRASAEMKIKGKRQQLSGEDDDEEENSNCIEISKKVSALRNASAHGGFVTQSETTAGLSNIRQLLNAFHLSDDQTATVQKKINFLLDDIKERDLWLCVLDRGEAAGAEFNSQGIDGSKRILRAGCQNFVGRGQAFLSAMAALQQVSTTTCRPAVLLSGDPGIGKSYLASKLVHSVGNSYKTQAWLSCVSPSHLLQDLECELPPRPVPAHEEEEAKLGNCSSPDASACWMTPNIANWESNTLLVLDDVRAMTVRLVHELITNSCSSIIITTKSPTVKLLLQNWLPYVHMIELKPFSLLESRSLVQCKANVSRFNELVLESIDKILSGILGNLPLSVNIYSSLIAAYTRKPDRVAFDVFNERQVLENWQSVEEIFGDRFHVRGLTGVVLSSERYLQKFPLVTFLLAKICLAESESVPWEVFERRGTIYFPQCCSENGLVKRLTCSLRGVTDWLFSDAATGRATLVLCRNALEELGLISWENSTSTLHIHLLTLKSAQRLLEENKLFMQDLLLRILQHRHVAFSNMIGEKVSSFLNTDLLCHVLNTCTDIIQRALGSASENKLNQLERSFPAFAVLAKVVGESRHLTVWRQCHLRSGLRAELVARLIEYAVAFNLPVLKDLCLPWLSVQQEYPQKDFATAQAHDLWPNFAMTSLAAIQNVSAGLFKNAQDSFEELLRLDRIVFGNSSEQVVLTLCEIARCIEKERGRRARKEYLQAASKKYPQLKTLQNANDMREDLSHLFKESEQRTRKGIWEETQVRSELLQFWIEDDIAEKGEVAPTTLEAAELLIVFYEWQQQLAVKQMSKVQNKLTKFHSKLWKAKELSRWLKVTTILATLLLDSRQNGRLLRMMVNQFTVLESDLISTFAWSGVFTNLQAKFAAELKHFITTCAIVSNFVGHFALSERLCQKLLESFPCKQASEQGWKLAKTNDKQNEGNANFNASVKEDETGTATAKTKVFIDILLRLSKSIRLLHETMKFDEALNSLLHLFRQVICQGDLACTSHAQLTLNYIVRLCGLLGEGAADKTLVTMKALAVSSTTPSFWKAALQKAVTEVNKLVEQGELSTIRSHFVESKQALAKRNHLSARVSSLRCLKVILPFFRQSTRDDLNFASTCEKLLQSIVLGLADNLQQCYAEEKKLTVAAWFCRFRFHFTTRMKSYFLATRHGMAYAELLKEIGKTSEAVQQCRLVEGILVKEFGNDFADWLPGAPPVAGTLRNLMKTKNRSARKSDR